MSGKEIAVYHSYNLDHWNVWGTDNVGKINASDSKFFYIKDHLGSVRMVLNSDNQIVSAIDYDCWGYPLENRSYQSDDIDYKFTGKQRDTETGYDYFGARYYDARIARWGGVEPLLEKYISYSPYQYGLLNPMRLVDADGKDVYIKGPYATKTVIAMNEATDNNFFLSIDPSTGKLSYEGEAKTYQEFFLKIAIDDENSDVLLQTTEGNYTTTDQRPFAVGAYMGSQRNGKITESWQLFNIAHAEIWEKAGGSNIGLSAIHEILEAYFGGLLNPNQGYKNYDEDKQKAAHKVVVALEEPKQYNPILHNTFKKVPGGKIHAKATLYNEKTKKEYLLYENK